MSEVPLIPIVQVLPKLAYTLDEAAAATGIGRSTLYEDQAKGLLTMRKRGRTTLILAEELARYLGDLHAMASRADAEKS